MVVAITKFIIHNQYKRAIRYLQTQVIQDQFFLKTFYYDYYNNRNNSEQGN